MQEKDRSKPTRKEVAPSLFARNLKLLRTMRGVSQQKLADAIELKRNIIASYEAGIVEPSAERFLIIARYFGVDPYLLATNDLSQNPSEHLPAPAPVLESAEITEKLDTLVNKSLDLQKVIEGFKAFYEVKKQGYNSENADLMSLTNDFENLISILENLLKTNWDFIQEIQE